MFGLRPSLDECLLTLCDQCGAVIKTQALYSHIGTCSLMILLAISQLFFVI